MKYCFCFCATICYFSKLTLTRKIIDFILLYEDNDIYRLLIDVADEAKMMENY